MRRLSRAALTFALGGIACAPNDRAARDDTATFARYDAGAVPGGPGTGTRYAFGRPPSASELSALATAVAPDGAGLPHGRGNADDGATLYSVQCASCHGANGEGIAPNPALIGRDSLGDAFAFGRDPKVVKTIGNYWPYATTVFDYVRRAMPLTAPGSLSNDQVYALTAFLLAANRVIPAGATLDSASLLAVKMPARDRFVPDTRTGGAGVR